MLSATLTAEVAPLSNPLIREHLFDLVERVPQRDQVLACGDAVDGARLFGLHPPGSDGLFNRERLCVEVRVREVALGQKAGMKALDVLAVQTRRGGCRRGRTRAGAELARRCHGFEASTSQIEEAS